MKKIRNILFIIIVICGVVTLNTSCEKMFGDFLEQAPGVNITLDTLFSSQRQVETLIPEIYLLAMPNVDGTGNNLFGNATNWGHNNLPHYENMSDAGVCCDVSFSSHVWNNGAMTTSAIWNEDRHFTGRWNAIQSCYILLNGVGNVPMDQTYIDQIKGEAKFLIATNYFEMLRKYGGLPLVHGTFDLSQPVPKLPRNSIDSTIQFIVKKCDEAAQVLPDAWTSNWTGRATKGAALGLKARALLWAASPLVNSTTPYMSFSDPANNKIISYLNYDKNRWKLAADAAKAVLDWAPAGGRALITNQGVDKNYKYVWERFDHSEVLIACKLTYFNSRGSSNAPWIVVFPKCISTTGWGGTSPLQSFIENTYDNRYTGKPIAWKDSGTDLVQKYDSMDYRFKQSIAYNGSFFNNTWGIVELFQGGKYNNANNATGYALKKWIPDSYTGSASSATNNFPYLRLAEFYLSYAEALNEFNATPPQEAYDAVNAIRSRSGMPDLPTGLTQEQFRAAVVKEWSAEYYCEYMRLWNIYRWRIADQPNIMGGPKTKLIITKGAVVGGVQQFSYQRAVYSTRVWQPHYYFIAIRQEDVNAGSFIQNPGW